MSNLEQTAALPISPSSALARMARAGTIVATPIYSVCFALGRPITGAGLDETETVHDDHQKHTARESPMKGPSNAKLVSQGLMEPQLCSEETNPKAKLEAELKDLAQLYLVTRSGLRARSQFVHTLEVDLVEQSEIDKAQEAEDEDEMAEVEDMIQVVPLRRKLVENGLFCTS